MNHQTVNIFGLGYIGLPTAAVLAEAGFHVNGVDIDEHKVNAVNQGTSHFDEPLLQTLLQRTVQDGHLVADREPKEADIHIIAVPTPRIEAHTPDLSYIYQAVFQLASVLRQGDLVIIESTTPVGTTEKVSQWLDRFRSDLDMGDDNQSVSIAYCPERVLPGHIIEELLHNDRIIGGLTKQCAQKAQSFYQCFVKGTCRITHARTAEIAKLTENAFRDINIAFANELSMICDKIDVDVWELIELVNQHPRVKLLKPGPGVGGHCIAVDPWFIVNSAPDESRLVRTAREVNDKKPKHVVSKVINEAEKLKEPVIACLGITFKADVNDLRESPALNITSELSERFDQLYVVEPNIEELPPTLKHKANVTFMDLAQALNLANVIVLLVDHQAFHVIDSNQLSTKLVVDTRGLLSHPAKEHIPA